MRKKVTGTAERPRLVVFRSLKHIYAQLVDDVARPHAADRDELDGRRGKEDGEVDRSRASASPREAKDAGITKVVFDRAGYKYHGRVKAVADGAREGGLEF